MLLIPIQVESYAGYKANESPRRFFWKDHWIEVNEILDRWYQARPDPEWPLANYFKVAGDDGRQYLLKHDQESNEWFMGREW